ITGLTAEALIRCEEYSWPGNVRQLHNVLRHAALTTVHTEIDAADLPLFTDTDIHVRRPRPLADAVEATERQLIAQALAEANGNRDAAAAALGISRRTLFEKLRRARLAQGDEEKS